MPRPRLMQPTMTITLSNFQTAPGAPTTANAEPNNNGVSQSMTMSSSRGKNMRQNERLYNSQVHLGRVFLNNAPLLNAQRCHGRHGRRAVRGNQRGEKRTNRQRPRRYAQRERIPRENAERRPRDHPPAPPRHRQPNQQPNYPPLDPPPQYQ